MGFAMTLFALAVFELRDRAWCVRILPFIVATLWIIAEWLQAILSSLFMLGSTSTLNSYFTLASLGYAFAGAESEFWISLARWGGVPLLTVVPILIAAFSVSATIAGLKTERGRYFATSGIIVLILFLFGSTLAGSAAERMRGQPEFWDDQASLVIVAAQTHFPSRLQQSASEINRRSEIVVQIAESLRENRILPDVLVLPEGVGIHIDADAYQNISKYLPAGSLIIHGKYAQRPKDPSIVQIRAHRIKVSSCLMGNSLRIIFQYHSVY
jgi:apolipoprotein N-acyltransferase